MKLYKSKIKMAQEAFKNGGMNGSRKLSGERKKEHLELKNI